ncbi:hypothetical protein [Leekyejoonella antrihumi]|uniref:Uncharacterized protein n=1 Tax=Leekyejoonella antrihumi TaxID=1660198 RepID=A0A563E073_9MICO|nr:hypothetical protein [Leekyejoonella antrihumi]TWP35940.1 hypothetical protein FGL98_11960 [Leekyejoonella antrihumi]
MGARQQIARLGIYYWFFLLAAAFFFVFVAVGGVKLVRAHPHEAAVTSAQGFTLPAGAMHASGPFAGDTYLMLPAAVVEGLPPSAPSCTSNGVALPASLFGTSTTYQGRTYEAVASLPSGWQPGGRVQCGDLPARAGLLYNDSRGRLLIIVGLGLFATIASLTLALIGWTLHKRQAVASSGPVSGASWTAPRR